MAETTERPVVFGATYSVYVRIVRLALEEKGVGYDLEEVDIFAPDGPPPGYLERHPFGRIPAFQHGDVRLFEAAAICRYADEAFDGPSLTSDRLDERALMAQTIGMLDSYAYRALVWDVFVETVANPAEGDATDPAVVERGLKTAEVVVRVMDQQLAANSYLAGADISLADLHAWPMIDYFKRSPQGGEMIGRRANLKAWVSMMLSRPSALATAFPDEAA